MIGSQTQNFVATVCRSAVEFSFDIHTQTLSRTQNEVQKHKMSIKSKPMHIFYDISSSITEGGKFTSKSVRMEVGFHRLLQMLLRPDAELTKLDLGANHVEKISIWSKGHEI